MAHSTGPVLAIGAITVANEVVLHSGTFTWKVPLATGIAALMLAGLEEVSPALAVGIAWVALAAVLFTRVDPNIPAPAESLANIISARKA